MKISTEDKVRRTLNGSLYMFIIDTFVVTSYREMRKTEIDIRYNYTFSVNRTIFMHYITVHNINLDDLCV